MTTRDERRIAYLAGDLDVALSEEDRRELDEIRAVLADPVLWDHSPTSSPWP